MVRWSDAEAGRYREQGHVVPARRLVPKWVRRMQEALGRYMPGSSLFDRSLKPSDGQTGVPVSFATRPLWLLRGEDRTGRNDFVVGHRGC